MKLELTPVALADLSSISSYTLDRERAKVAAEDHHQSTRTKPESVILPSLVINGTPSFRAVATIIRSDGSA